MCFTITYTIMNRAAINQFLNQQELSLGREAGIVIGASLFIAAMAQLEIPMFPVPVTGQTLAVMLVGLILGPVRGGLAALAYLVEGAAGLPVFAGFSSTAALFGPTAGFLFSFVPAAFVAGLISQKFNASLTGLVIASVVSTAVVFAIGLTWLYPYFPADVLTVGLIPFLPGAALKIVAAVGISYGVLRK